MPASRKSRPRIRAAVIPFPRVRGRRRTLAALAPSGRSLLAGFALLAVAGGAYAGARASSAFAVHDVVVRGGTPAVARDVRAATRDFAGTSLLALDGDELVARVEAIPSVLSAGYDRAFPHTLVIAVERELPVAVLRRGAESWLLSARGRVIRELAKGAHPRLPRIWAPKSVEAAPGALVTDAGVLLAARAVRALPATFPARVRTVRASRQELTLQLGSGLELRLGDAHDLALKYAVASRVLPLVEVGPGYLDVSLPDRPVAGDNSQVEG